MAKHPPAIRRLLGLLSVPKEGIVKPTLLLAAFTIGLVVGNRTGRQALYAELTEAFPEFFLAPCSESNGDAVVRLRGEHG